MTLVLRIENYDQLDNGGPISISLGQRDLCAGRRSSMDWVLPDPARIISGHHFDVLWYNGCHWLRDVSCNGTRLYAQGMRLAEPVLLEPGMRFEVGHYILVVEDSAQAQPQAQTQEPDEWSVPDVADPRSAGYDRPASAASAPDAASIQSPLGQQGYASALQTPHGWSNGAGDPSAASSGDDVWADFAQEPAVAQSEPYGESAAAEDPAHYAPPPPQTPAEQMPESWGPDDPAGRPHYHRSSSFSSGPVHGHPHASDLEYSPRHEPVPPAPPAAAPMPRFGAPPGLSEQAYPDPAQDQPPQETTKMQDAFDAFCEGAGLETSDVDHHDLTSLMYALGRSARCSTEEVMRMLEARRSMKINARAGQSTMRKAENNNPLKLCGSPSEALLAMYLAPRDGFMDGPDALVDALVDLRLHQVALLQAVQPALQELLAGLSPEEIEEAAEGTGRLLSGNRKARLWALFVDRWDAKAARGEAGIANTFFQKFFEAYASSVQSKGPSG